MVARRPAVPHASPTRAAVAGPITDGILARALPFTRRAASSGARGSSRDGLRSLLQQSGRSGGATGAHATLPMFYDRPEDASLPAAIAHVMELRARANAGAIIPKEDLIAFTRSSVNNDAKLHLDRAFFQEGLMPAIDAAQDSIHIAALMFDDGIIGSDVADRLIAKKRANPAMAIRVLVDGQLHPLFDTKLDGLDQGASNLRRLRAEGIDVQMHPTWSTRTLEHRKLCIIDGKKALLSGANLSSEYYATAHYRALYETAVADGGDAVDRFVEARSTGSDDMARPWAHDFGMELTGPVVLQLQASYLQSFIHRAGSLEPERTDDEVKSRYFPQADAATGASGGGRAKLTNSIPQGTSEIRATFQDFIASAKETLDIEVAYVVVPEFVKMLEAAADRGVKIRLITNGHDSTDYKATYFGFRRLAEPLLQKPGVEIFEAKTFTHIKLFVADGRYVLATTGNPERLSWERAFDETIALDSPALARDVLARVISPDMTPEHAARVDPATVAGRGMLARWTERAWDALFTVALPLACHDGERALPNGPLPAAPDV